MPSFWHSDRLLVIKVTVNQHEVEFFPSLSPPPSPYPRRRPNQTTHSSAENEQRCPAQQQQLAPSQVCSSYGTVLYQIAVHHTRPDRSILELSSLCGLDTCVNMDEARALLEQLMGRERDVPMDKRLNRKRRVSDDDICKPYLCGATFFWLWLWLMGEGSVLSEWVPCTACFIVPCCGGVDGMASGEELSSSQSRRDGNIELSAFEVSA